jgi:hypothetical protein
MFASSRRIGTPVLAAVIWIFSDLSGGAFAQNTPGGNQRDNSGLNGSLSREDLEKLNGPKSMSHTDASQNTPQARAKAKLRSEELVKTLQLSCDVIDAELVVSGTSRSAAGGKEVETRVYEVACRSGMGYLLEARGSETPVGISCVAAEAAHAADAAKGKKPGFFCQLPENRDVKAVAATMMAAAGTPCTVNDVRWFGRSSTTQSEYSEVVCDDGNGYLLRTALPGSQAQTTVLSCADAAKQGIKCRLTDSGPIESPVTLDTFKGALAQNGVSCKIDQIREVGQEEIRKRYVVEYLCANRGAGMVAFIPLAGNSNPYESVDCAAAAMRGVVCTFAPLK